MKRNSALIVVACAAVAGCATMEPVAERWTPPPVGATWEVAQHNTGSYGKDTQFKVTRIAATWQGRPAVGFRASTGVTTMAHPDSGRWMAIVLPDGKPAIAFDPPIGWDHPVKVGTTSRAHYKLTFADGKAGEYDYACVTEAYEKLTVRAGTFDTFRVACRSTGGNADTFWMAPSIGVFVKIRQERLPGNASGAGVQVEELLSYQAPR